MRSIAIITTTLLLAACQPGQKAEKPPESTYDVGIRWTSYGIPHVKATDWGSLGYGFAYATATDAICVIARDVLMVNGELSKHHGPEDGHFSSDAFHKGILTQDKVTAYNQAQSARDQAFADGYVAGYNRYLRDHANALPASCAGAPWVAEIDADDLTRLTLGVGIRYGLGRFGEEISQAAPPESSADEEAGADDLASRPIAWRLPEGIGSNGVAIGSELSASGRGILLGNPHYPWHGASRFHLIHTTIPGEVDVMGVSLLNTSRVIIGFNKDMAWTHTVSTALRFTLHQLDLNPDNPLQYRYDGAYRDIEARVVAVEVATGDGVETQEQTIYLTHYGPLLENDLLPWSASRAYALRDAVIDNYVTAETYDAMSKAASTADLEAAISRQGVFWVNTIAADRHGNAFYADISGTPNVDADLLDACRLFLEGAPERLVILDGSRAECEWREDERSRVPGTLPPEEMPRLTRADYVTNSNDSYWLSNPDAPLEGYSPVIGPERTARSLRTRAGLHMLGELIERGGGIAPDDIQALLDNNRHYGAELLLDDVLRVCGDQADLAPACEALSAWNRTMNVDAQGGHVWREFWNLARHIDDLWAVPFDAEDPVATPRGINLESAAVRQAVADALRDAANTLAEVNIPLNARLGDIQYAPRNDRNIPIPGGDGGAGMFSMIVTKLNGEKGYTPIIHGNSYIQVISWDAEGNLDPRAMLTYSQSPEPDSPHYSDLTEIHAQGGWIRLPFTDADIEADPNLRTLNLTE
ncbi:MAG: penicillin acylase family protein [Gammaproteobacteria bacterium]|nr:penicillin acylase family protein [Gammaproteobacteria bacterium]